MLYRKRNFASMDKPTADNLSSTVHYSEPFRWKIFWFIISYYISTEIYSQNDNGEKTVLFLDTANQRR